MTQVIQFHTHTHTHMRRPYWAYVWFYDILRHFSLQTLLHQGLWAFQGKQRCHSRSYPLIYTVSNSIVVPELMVASRSRPHLSQGFFNDILKPLTEVE